MIAVGIDVSKSKSTVAILNSDGSLRIKPYDMKHNHPEMNALINYLNELDEPIIILMEYTGHYHYPVLKKLTDEHFPVCLVNPYQMKNMVIRSCVVVRLTKKMLSESLLMLWKILSVSSVFC